MSQILEFTSFKITSAQKSFSIDHESIMIQKSYAQEVLEFAQRNLSGIMFFSCDICSRMGERNLLGSRICSQCETDRCFVCKKTHSECIERKKRECNQISSSQIFIQLAYLVIFFFFSVDYGHILQSWIDCGHIALVLLSFYLGSKIIFVYSFYPKNNQPEDIYMKIGFGISAIVICTLPISMLIEAIMLKVALKVALEWVMPPIVG
jgi:hypothetical protein